jgi:hypothetical protein
MGWGDMMQIPNEYNDEVKNIDEQLLQLFHERKRQTGGKNYFPPKELLQIWSEKFQLPIPQISWFLRNFSGSQPEMPNETGELLGILSIMKKSIVGDCEYTLTHAMQHEHASIVFIEIKRTQPNESNASIHPQLLLEIRGNQEYSVRNHGFHGGGAEAQGKYLVSPRLPDNISLLAFSLIPYSSPMENRRYQEVVLDQQVDFE